MNEMFLLKLGEIVLKGGNRFQFENRLKTNVARRMRPFGDFRVSIVQSTVYVEPENADCDLDCEWEACHAIFGVVRLCRCRPCAKDLDAIFDTAMAYLGDDLSMAKSFKVESRRSDKRYPLDSPAIMREAGGYILEHVPHLSVDVNHPDHTMMIEIRDHAYLSVKRIPAVEGMPMGTNGKACLLLSGGIDSPVAGFMIAKRGVELCCVHYHSFPYTSERAREKVLELARLLSEYCGKMRVHVVPFTEIQMQIHAKCPENYTTLIMRRYMMRIAEIIARKDGAQALITGESIGQVASQTMEALGCTDAVVNMPVFRPAIGMDKSEIIERAQKIGTFETSSLPYEDCCTVFTPKHPATHPRIELIQKAEDALDSEALIAAAIEGTEVIEVG